MKKPVLYGLIALVVVGVGAAVYALTKGDDKNNSQTSSQSSNQSENKHASINALLSQNQNIKCTYSHTDENGNKSSGTAYIAGKRMSGNFTVQTAGQAQQKSNVLRDNEYQYIWQEGATTGFKAKVTETSTDQGDDNNTVDQDKEYDFECSEWSVDESLFKVPSGIEFTDYSAQVEQLQQNTEDVCASIADANARAACESAL